MTTVAITVAHKHSTTDRLTRDIFALSETKKNSIKFNNTHKY